MNVVELSSISKVYGRKRAVDHLDMTVQKGDIYGFIGRNGAGKSTTLKMICGLAAPTAGDIRLFGKTVKNDTVRKRTGMLIENAGLYPGLSARENMLLKAKCLGLVDAVQKTEELLSFTGLADVGKKKTKHFSMGMKQRLGIALALLGNPDLLILDEPINGLDPEGIREIRSMLVSLNEERGITIIISSPSRMHFFRTCLCISASSGTLGSIFRSRLFLSSVNWAAGSRYATHRSPSIFNS